MRIALALGVGLVALAYSHLFGAFARFIGVAPSTSFTVDLTAFYLGLITLMSTAVYWTAKRIRSR